MLDDKLVVYVLFATRNKTKLRVKQQRHGTSLILPVVCPLLLHRLLSFRSTDSKKVSLSLHPGQFGVFESYPLNQFCLCAYVCVLLSGHQFSLLLKDPDQPENAKSLKVTIVGAPNAGKSTLTNQLLGRKLFAVSEKVHTTRSRAVGVLTEDDTQIILLDTPGLTTPVKAKRHHLEVSLLVDPFDSIKEADLVVVLVDVSDKWTRNKLDYEVLKCLALNPDVPAILVLNKVDLLKNKTLLLDITAQLTEGVVNGKKIRIRGAEKPHEKSTAQRHNSLKALKSRRGWHLFKDVFMLSSIDREDVETLKKYLFDGAKPGHWQYHSEVLTDQGPEEMCINTIREKLLQHLPKEVPYSMTQQIEIWKESEDGVLDISIKLYVKKDTHMKMVIGSGGHLITRITQEAESDLMKIFLREVRLKISAKLKK
uniref:GTPase Era, mitochondrial n=1 Tax=Cyprinus carpio TaxID=7962 RepID=A0A8C2C4E7_CYPCA